MKKLLLSLGAIASVAAPVAAVVACGSTTPDATPTNTGTYAKVNAAIAKIISDNASEDLTAKVAQKMTGQVVPQEVYPAMATEGDLARQIKLVDGGFTVQIKNTVTKFDETYFIENNKDATVQALIAKLTKDYHSDVTTAKAYVAKTPVAFTGVKLTYIDATGQGIALLDAKAVTGFFNMKSAEFDLIKAEITKALAPKAPAKVAPKTTGTQSATAAQTTTLATLPADATVYDGKKASEIAAAFGIKLDGLVSKTDATNAIADDDALTSVEFNGNVLSFQHYGAFEVTITPKA